MKINNNKQRLKTYKIKNHNSGKTYSVKAVSYTDAKMKYNKYILKDADKSMGTYNGYTIKQNVYGDIYVLKKSGEKEFFESWKKAYEAIKSGAIRDSLTEDAAQPVEFTASIVFTSDKPKTRGTNKGYTGGSYGGGSFNINQTIGDVITSFYNIMKKDFDDAASANIRVKKLSIAQYTRGNRNSFRQLVNIKEVEGKDVQSAIQIGNSIKLSKYIKDSLTEDAHSYDKYYLRRRRDKFTFSGIRGMWDEVIASYSFKKHENPDAFISIIKKYVDFNMTTSQLLSRAPGFLMIFNSDGKQLKDSLTEDDKNDFTYKGYLVLAEYQLGSKNIAQYKIFEPNGNYLFAVKTPEQAKKVIDNEVKRRMNDADIAQNDIKSTYLP